MKKAQLNKKRMPRMPSDFALTPAQLLLGFVTACVILLQSFGRRGNADADLQQSYRRMAESDRKRLEKLEKRLEKRDEEYAVVREQANSAQAALIEERAKAQMREATEAELRKQLASQGVELAAAKQQLAQIPDLLRQIQQMQIQIDTLNADLKTIRASIAEKDAEIDRLRGENDELNKRLRENESRIRELEEEKRKLEQQQAAQNGKSG
jgi:chromosome segregation ATPase